MTANLRHAAGSLLVVGLSGTELTALERAWLRLLRPAGMILFRRNIVDAKQSRALLADAGSYCTSNSLRCVDVEGGTVDRLRDALAPMPSPQAVALSGNASLARTHGELIARGVQAFGFNVTLAPVLDLALPASAKVMGTRAAASDAAGVIEYACSFLDGLTSQNIAGCGKHFPGLGGGTLDSHNETPMIRLSLSELWQEDLAPYRMLGEQLPMIMVNHAAYPDTPGRGAPATASRFWITTILRKRVGYRGLIFSDDLEMGGILKSMPIEEAAVTAIRAGMNLLEVCHSAELILRAFEALISEAERSATFRQVILERARHTARLRTKLFARPMAPALSPKQFESLRTRILRFGQSFGELQRASATAVAVHRPANHAETA